MISIFVDGSEPGRLESRADRGRDARWSVDKKMKIEIDWVIESLARDRWSGYGYTLRFVGNASLGDGDVALAASA